jgi:drug/metabolite transporter (DMT)-like permease
VAVLLADGSKGPPGAVVVLLLVMRASSVLLLALVGAVVLARGRRALPGLEHGHLGLLAAVGLGDAGANAAFAAASRGGLLSVVAVLGSLYPVVTVLLARQLHGERLRRVQVAGVLGTLAGVALLAAG